MSRNAIASIANKGLDPTLTDAEHVIQWLDEQVDMEHMSYQALYHKVSETSLLLISKAQKRKEMLKEKLREAQALKDKKPPTPPVSKPSGKRRRGKRRATKFDTSPSLSLDDFTLTEAEMEVLAGDIARSGKVDLYMKGKKTSDSEPVVKTQLLKKMQELLDLGETLDAVEQQLKVDDKVLLGVAWCREDERLLFEKYPSVLLFDVTYKTNREQRPLGVVAAVDNNMEIFTPMRVFMPSEQGWVFDWIFKSCIPNLLGRENIKRTNVVLTDGARQMYSAFDDNQADLYPNAKHVLCMFHLVNKGLERLNCRLLGTDRDVVKGQIQAFKETIFSWCRLHGIENQKEFQCSLAFLRGWLTEQRENANDDVDYDVSHNAQVLQDFLMRNIYPHRNRFLVYLRNDRMCLDYRSTSALESQFQKMKRKCSPCLTPNMTLLKSMQTQDLQRRAKMDMRVKVAFKQYNSSPNHSHGSLTKDAVSSQSSCIVKDTCQIRMIDPVLTCFGYAPCFSYMFLSHLVFVPHADCCPM